MKRCEWCGSDEDYVAYHDEEWGVPVRDDVQLFEMLTLEGAQAGLSWLTVLRKREGYRKAFVKFDFNKVARFTKRDQTRLLQDPGIVRNRLKIESTIRNAKAIIAIREEFGSFDQYIWQFVDHKPIQNRFITLADIPAKTPISDAMSKDLKKRGCNFVGSTICYAFMQATGMVNDHVTSCFRHAQVKKLG